MKRRFTTIAVIALACGTAACGADTSDAGGGPSGSSTASGGSKITVYAAASLKSTFEHLGQSFEKAHDGTTVEFNFAGSSDLVSQIKGGAPADVFASADEKNMTKLTADKLHGSDPKVFATNTLEIATPPDNPAGVTSLKDLADKDITLVVCAPEVPCGAATGKVAKAAGITLSPDSEEQSVTDVLGKVKSGEADAGLVYVTDVIGAGDAVKGIEFPESTAVTNRYPIATVAVSRNAALGQQFVDLVLSDEGQKVLADAGFGRP
ncbi:MAG: molybdate ABC transporter substrate-binding protein [Micrococcales bacterium]|nr:molybdate ABC transporter substrate-binding protein [Micrococcales bacterium]